MPDSDGRYYVNTTATNRKVRELLTAMRDGRLEPRPEFQRRLVWSTKHKLAFIETVLLGYPFPEIYVAAGSVDSTTGESTELLVDGQQRVTSLNQFFLGHPDFAKGGATPYEGLSHEEKLRFLEYPVVVRDLGHATMAEVREVFRRINSTSYALNPIELAHARYDGELKRFGETVAESDFFDRHRVFHTTEVRRMGDLRFALVLVVTMMSSYFNRDDELPSYLERYNEDFDSLDLAKRLADVYAFVDDLGLEQTARAWQKADLLTLLVEVDRYLRPAPEDTPIAIGYRLRRFYQEVDAAGRSSADDPSAREYYLAAVQASNDRSSRIRRGALIQTVLADREENAHGDVAPN